MKEYNGKKNVIRDNISALTNVRRLELVLVDFIIIVAAYMVMIFLSCVQVGSISLNGTWTVPKFAGLTGCILLSRCFFGIYNSIWRYANIGAYSKLMLSDVIAVVVFFVIGRFVSAVYMGFAYSAMSVMLIIFLTLASRFTYQSLYTYVNRVTDMNIIHALFGKKNTTHKINVAIVGAGNVGAYLADELLRNPTAHYNPYCFIDKDVKKIGSGLNGIMVYSEDDKIISTIKSMPVQEIVIAIPDASNEDKKKLYDMYSETGCKVKLYDYPLNEKERIKSHRLSLREFRIEDLLFRAPLEVNSERAKAYYTGKVVMVTGGGGSIGSELCRQIASLKPKKLIILDIYENNAYDIEQELLRKYGNDINITTLIASVRDEKRLDEIFDEIRPEIVFHAAAHKHVPLMEKNGCEAIKNNVLGTYNVANMAEKYGASRFLLISTDKAVNPTNIMGASKRLCEMVIQCRTDGQSKTEFTAVRFGNVLGSNGSVIPLFKRQIESGGPITITDKRIIRYFMTIPEAVGLVMEAVAMAHNGELFVLDMGKPVKILDLAENMIKLSGLTPYKDIDIQEIGLRPGEKLYEELLMKTEELDKTDNEMIFIERDTPVSRQKVDEKLQILIKALESDSKNAHHDAVIEAIKKVVPTYHSPEEINRLAKYSEEMSAINECNKALSQAASTSE